MRFRRENEKTLRRSHELGRFKSNSTSVLVSILSSAQLDKKRDEFRKYLEGAGAIDNLTKALIKLYEQQNKPSDAVKFLRKNMCESCPDDEQFETLSADLEKANKKICELERELSKMKGSLKRSASEVELALTKGFEQLSDVDDSPSLLKKFLTKDMIEQLTQKTSFKGTLLDCIQAGMERVDLRVGIFACDAEAYSAFSPLFDQVIEEIHGFKKEEKHPSCDWGEPCNLPELDPSGQVVLSVSVECSRNVECFPYAAIMSMEQYEEILGKLQRATKCMSGGLKGNFYPLEGINLEVKKTLVSEKIMFESNEVLKAANAARFWPTGRGVYVNEAKTFVIWCNQEDHLRFISLGDGANLSKPKLTFSLLKFFSSKFCRGSLRSFDDWREENRERHCFRLRRPFGIPYVQPGKLGQHDSRIGSAEAGEAFAK